MSRGLCWHSEASENSAKDGGDFSPGEVVARLEYVKRGSAVEGTRGEVLFESPYGADRTMRWGDEECAALTVRVGLG